MLVGKIGHASLEVHTREVTCLMDPILVESFECGTNRFHPRTRIDRDAIGARFDLAIISHEHMDHFSVRTLAHLDRAIPVLYPRGAALIELALARLGFGKARAIVPGEKVSFRDLTLTATASQAPFPEMGVLFRSGGASFWNPVDSIVGERAQALVRGLAPRLDLMFAYYQPLIESPMIQDALGAEFPYRRYGQLLRDVLEVRPRCVAPGACGFEYALNAWQNERGFPMSEGQFLADVRQLDPGIVTRQVPHGAAIEVGGEFAVHEGVFEFLEVSPGTTGEDRWRPHRGVPPLSDGNPFGHDPALLRRRVIQYLEGPFLARLTAPENGVWYGRLAELGLIWELELVFPDGPAEVRWLELGRSEARWTSAPGSRLCKIITAIPASTVFGLLEGEYDAYAANLTRRVAMRLYEPHRFGIARVGSIDDEPLARVLFPGADRRYLERELALVGAGEGASRRAG